MKQQLFLWVYRKLIKVRVEYYIDKEDRYRNWKVMFQLQSLKIRVKSANSTIGDVGCPLQGDSIQSNSITFKITEVC